MHGGFEQAAQQVYAPHNGHEHQRKRQQRQQPEGIAHVLPHQRHRRRQQQQPPHRRQHKRQQRHHFQHQPAPVALHGANAKREQQQDI